MDFPQRTETTVAEVSEENPSPPFPKACIASTSSRLSATDSEANPSAANHTCKPQRQAASLAPAVESSPSLGLAAGVSQGLEADSSEVAVPRSEASQSPVFSSEVTPAAVDAEVAETALYFDEVSSSAHLDSAEVASVGPDSDQQPSALDRVACEGTRDPRGRPVRARSVEAVYGRDVQQLTVIITRARISCPATAARAS